MLGTFSTKGFAHQIEFTHSAIEQHGTLGIYITQASNNDLKANKMVGQ